MRNRILLTGLSAFCLLFQYGCSPLRPLRVEPVGTAAAYGEYFPHSVEVCALSRIRPLGDDKKRSRAGHGVLFLEGVCLDSSAGFPLLQLCPQADAAEHGESGVGISVNRMFRNVNWVAAPGRNFFYHGDHPADAAVTQAVKDRVIDRAVERGIYRGVEVHDRYMDDKPDGDSVERHIASQALATDYALNFGRSALCVNVPVTPAMMEEVVVYLNDLNRRYALTETQYKWNLFTDNCTHTIYNALSTVHMLSPRVVKRGKVRKFFNLALPAHAVVATLKLASPDPLENIREIKKNPKQRKALLKYGWLPMRHGVLLSVLSMNENNELFQADPSRFETIILRSKWLQSKRNHLKEALSDERLTDLDSNLAWFESQYALIRDNCRSKRPPRGFNGEFYETYCNYIESQLENIRATIKRRQGE